jgi:plastocyanin
VTRESGRVRGLEIVNRNGQVMFATFRSAVFICAAWSCLGIGFVMAAAPVASRSSDVVTVKMTPEHHFVPEQITIQSGQIVEWVNEEKGGIHQVTTDPDVAVDPDDVSMPGGAEPFDSRLIKSGQSFRHQFTVPGVYQYVCPPHEQSGMIGKVTVTK